MPVEPTDDSKEDLRDSADEILHHIICLAEYRSQNMLSAKIDLFGMFKSTTLQLDNIKDETARKAHYKTWKTHYESPTKTSTKAFEQQAVREGKEIVDELRKSGFPLSGLNADLAIQHGYASYKYLRKMQHGSCGRQVSAGLLYALIHCDIPVAVVQGDKKCFDHAFLVIGELPFKDGQKIKLKDLPETCLIVDPWTGCKFAPSQAETFWEQLAKEFHWNMEEVRVGAAFSPLDEENKQQLQQACERHGLNIVKTSPTPELVDSAPTMRGAGIN